MNETVILTPEEQKARKRRNMWLALSIGAFIVLVFAITVSKMQAFSLLGLSAQ
ncbi:hypothetical protein [Vitreimonas flagellata]|uniref:hypothetical protein n=1 Tax=Vitreimonas flagellata TaxID=2560861 RepID=UPI00143207B5|nr:hypothetical protein [Vitreimonas flagellata]